jgi:hypothetical protein
MRSAMYVSTYRTVKRRRKHSPYRDRQPHFNPVVGISCVACGAYSLTLAPFVEDEHEEAPDEQANCNNIEPDDHEGVDAVEREFVTTTADQSSDFGGIKEKWQKRLQKIRKLTRLVQMLSQYCGAEKGGIA